MVQSRYLEMFPYRILVPKIVTILCTAKY